jgi:hypothetical protein
VKTNFDLVDSFALSSGEVWADLHNDFDFYGVDMNWETRTVTLTWHRATGDWVSKTAPRSLRVEFLGVKFLLMNLGGEGDPATVDAAGYIRCDAPAAEEGFLPDRGAQSDHLVLMWDNGAYLRIYAESAALEVVS